MAISLTITDQLSALRPQLLRFTRQRVHDDAIAEDLVQESLLAVLEAPERYAGKSSLATYVIAIIKFKIIDNFRRSKYVQANLADHPIDNMCLLDNAQQVANVRYGVTDSSLCEEFNPMRALEQKNFFTQLESALSQLPEKNAQAFMLLDCLEVDSADICTELGISKNNLLVSVHRARHALRKVPSLKNFCTTSSIH